MKLPKDIVLAFTMFKIHYFEMMHQNIYLVIEGAGLYISCRFKDGRAQLNCIFYTSAYLNIVEKS